MTSAESPHHFESVEAEYDPTAAADGARFEQLVGLLHERGVTRTSISDWPVWTEPGMIEWEHVADKGNGPGFTRYLIDKKGLIRGVAAPTRDGLAERTPKRIGAVERSGLIGGLESMVGTSG